MADKLAELKAALEGLSDEGLKVVVEFAKYLTKIQSDQRGENQAKLGKAEGDSG